MTYFSYIQTILHYPGGGGAYTVAKDNLGALPSLFAAGALLTDYVLTVSVSVSAGIRALTSAFPGLFDYRVGLALAAIILLTWVNLRGVRESGTVFALPTYAFVSGVLLVIVIGLVRYVGWFGAVPLDTHPLHVEAVHSFTGFAYLWLILRAFAGGCTALTGIEAISNGVQAFQPPEPINANKTMVWMGAMAMALFMGISFLATHLAIVPIADIHRGTLRALKYAKRISSNVRAVCIVTSTEQKERITQRWTRFPELTADVELVCIDYDYRDVLEPLVEYITHANNVEFANQLTTVVIPEFVSASLPAQLLHNQTANILRLRLRTLEDLVIIDVPYLIKSPQTEHKALLQIAPRVANVRSMAKAP